jgi:putative hydrolase of the HAD superfamily
MKLGLADLRQCPLQGLLFDYGGTLDGAASHWLDRFVRFYRDAGLDVPFDDIRRAFCRADDEAYADSRVAGMTLRELMYFHVAHQLDALSLDRPDLQDHLVARFVEETARALQGSRKILAALSMRYRLGVVSNFYGNVGRILRDAGFGPLLSVVIDSNLVGVRKPDPAIYALAVSQLGTAAAQTMHVGDSYERDICAARAAGLRTAWLIGERSADVDCGDCLADLRLRSLDELEPALERPSALAAT